MKEIKPVYIKLLLLAIVFYVAGVCYLQTDVEFRLGRIEHAMLHAGAASSHPHGQ